MNPRRVQSGPPDPTPAAVPQATERRDHRDLFVLAAAVLILVLFRLHGFSAPLEVDECNYAYFGGQLLAGERLYVDLWDHQPPGIFALTAGLVALFGSSPLVFRVASTIAAAASLVLVYEVCRTRLNRHACWLAAGLFAIASSDPGIAGEGCNREVYMNLLGVGGLYLALIGGRWGLVGAGLCLGFSSLLKTVAVAPWLMLAVALVVVPAPKSPGEALRRLLLFAVGPVLVWAVTFLYFQLTGRLDQFLDAAFIYNLEYGRVDIPLGRKLTAFFASWTVFRSDLPLWVAGGAGLLLLPWKRERRFALLVSAYAVGSFLAVCLPGRFWHHYYMLMLPSLVVGAVVILDRLIAVARPVEGGLPTRPTGTKPRPWQPAATVYATGLVLLVFALQFVFYLAQEPDDIALHRYGQRMSWGRDHGFRVRQVTAPDDYIYVCGIDTGIYYYSRRRCATRYTLATALMGNDEAAARRRQNLLDDLRAYPPRLILLIHGLPYIPELDRFIREAGYVKVGEDPERMDVLCDRARPLAPINWDHRPGRASSNP